MWKYLLKRLLIAVPTLLGITVITFCLIRLVPGDPAVSGRDGALEGLSGEVSREVLEKARELYGLDKPILINTDVQDRRRSVLSTWEECLRILKETELPGEEREYRLLREIQKLKAMGKRLIPHLVPVALSKAAGNSLELLLSILREGAGLEAARSQEDLAAWWKDSKSDYSDEAVRRRIMELESCAPEEIPARSSRIHEELGELALPHVVQRIKDLEDGSARRRLIAFAAPWAGVKAPLEMDSKADLYAVALQFIEKWWDRKGLAFREIGAGERFLKTFTDAQYPIWLGQILTLDFGESFIDHRPVMGKVWEAFKVTLVFQIVVIFLIYLISVPVGVYSAVKQDSLSDRLITVFLFVLYSLPNFWVAYMMIMLLCGGRFLDIFPIQGLNSVGADNMAFLPWFMDRVWHMCLPVACMTYGGLAVLSRYARSGMLEVIRQDYIRTARAKGLSERAVVMKHALRNGIIPIVTLIGGLLPALISGSVIVESIFGIPGMGMLGYHAVYQRDYPVVMAITFFSAILVLIGILLSDLLYVLVDPRISFEQKEPNG